MIQHEPQLPESSIAQITQAAIGMMQRGQLKYAIQLTQAHEQIIRENQRRFDRQLQIDELNRMLSLNAANSARFPRLVIGTDYHKQVLQILLDSRSTLKELGLFDAVVAEFITLCEADVLPTSLSISSKEGNQ